MPKTLKGQRPDAKESYETGHPVRATGGRPLNPYSDGGCEELRGHQQSRGDEREEPAITRRRAGAPSMASGIRA